MVENLSFPDLSSTKKSLSMAAVNQFLAGRRADLERKIEAIRREAMEDLDSIKRDFDKDQESSCNACNLFETMNNMSHGDPYLNCKVDHDKIREEERVTMEEIRKRIIEAVDALESDMRRDHEVYEARIRAANQNPNSFVLVLEEEKTYCIRDYYVQLPAFSGL